MSLHTPDRSALVYAVLAPASPDAGQAIDMRHNRFYIAHECEFGFLTGTVFSRGFVIRLDADSMAGRHCLTFGSSRSSNIQLPLGDDVPEQVFYLFFDPGTHSLCIKNATSQAIWLSSLHPRGPPKCLYRTETSVTSSVQIQFGHTNRFRFYLHVNTEGMSELAAAHSWTISPLFLSQKINRRPPIPQKRPRSNSIERDSVQCKKRKSEPGQVASVAPCEGGCRDKAPSRRRWGLGR
jgi:hypothetical protein